MKPRLLPARAALGIYPVILDEDANEVPAGSGKAGNICIRNPWARRLPDDLGPSQSGFVSTYFAKYNKDPKSTDWRGLAVTSPATARPRGADGYFRILGRVDGRDQRGRPPAGHQGAGVRRAPW